MGLGAASRSMKPRVAWTVRVPNTHPRDERRRAWPGCQPGVDRESGEVRAGGEKHAWHGTRRGWRCDVLSPTQKGSRRNHPVERRDRREHNISSTSPGGHMDAISTLERSYTQAGGIGANLE